MNEEIFCKFIEVWRKFFFNLPAFFGKEVKDLFLKKAGANFKNIYEHAFN